jgi:uncharacterized protein (DUF924 family)
MRDFNEVIHFWFFEIKPEQWWRKDEAFDALIRERFLSVHRQAMQGELYAWRDHPQGALAEVIVLDQFSRNMFRNQPESFASDPLALCLAQNSIKMGFDNALNKEEKAFLYMPFMHSESLKIHQIAVNLFEQADLRDNLSYEMLHKKIIDRFGRYPHRNIVLGRTSTPDEIEFLKEENSSF